MKHDLRRARGMGLGLAALGRPGYINLGHSSDLGGDFSIDAMEARAHGVLDAAYAEGVRYFDVARSYGKAEQFLGSWLRSRAPRDVLVGSKWGYTYTADWKTKAAVHEVKDHSLETLKRQWPETLSHLGDCVTLYQIHSATIETGVLTDQEVLAELARMKAGGVRIGLSVSGPAQSETIDCALAVRFDGARLFDSVQATYNLLEVAAARALRDAHAAGLTVIVKEGLANGRLTDRNHLPADKARLRELRAIAQEVGASLDALALGFVLGEPFVDIVLSGAALADHLRTNLRAREVVLGAARRSVLAGFAEDSAAYWHLRSELPWQ